jgi:hypothetical protein
MIELMSANPCKNPQKPLLLRLATIRIAQESCLLFQLSVLIMGKGLLRHTGQNWQLEGWWSVRNISLMIPPAARRFISQSAPNCFCPSPGLKMPSAANRFRSPRRSASKRSQRLPWACWIAHGNGASPSKPLWSMQGTETIQTFFKDWMTAKCLTCVPCKARLAAVYPHARAGRCRPEARLRRAWPTAQASSCSPVYGQRADRSAAHLCLANH